MSIAKTKAEIQCAYEKHTGYAAQTEYKKENTKQTALQLNIKTDAGILQKPEEMPNKQGFIKDSIRRNMQ